MHNGESLAALGAVMYYGPMQALTLQIVLNVATPLNWSVYADAQDAAAKEKEDAEPFEDCPTGALPLDFGITGVPAGCACLFHGLLVGLEIPRRLLLLIARYLLDWCVLPRRYGVLLLFLNDVLEFLLVVDGITFIVRIFDAVEFFDFVSRHIV